MRRVALLLALSAALAPRPARALRPDRALAQYLHDTWQDPLPQSTVLAITQTRDGYIWFTTYEGIVRFDGADFTVFDRRSDPGIATGAFSALAEDRDGTLWAGTIGSGLYRYREGRFSRVKVPGLGETVYVLHAAPGGALWAGTNRGLGRLERGAWSALGPKEGLPAKRVRAIASLAGDTWVGTDGGGLVRIHAGALSVLTKRDGLPSDVVYALAAAPDGTLWVGTESGVVTWREGRFTAPAGAAPLERSAIIALLFDRDGNLWSSSERNGLCRLGGGTLSCEERVSGGMGDLLRVFFEDAEGSLWMGGTSNGLHRIRDGKFATATGLLASNSVRSVTEDAAGTIWVGTEGAGLATLRQGTLVPWEGNAKLPSPFIRSVRADAGGLWVGTLRGVARVTPAGVRVYGAAQGLANELVYTTAAGSGGEVWIGTSGGLSRLDGDRVATYDAGPEVEDVRALLLDSAGRLWIGMRNGLKCLDGSRVGPCAPGLSIPTIFSFREEPAGTVWIGTGAGLVRVRGGRARTYTMKDGLFDDVVFEALSDGASLWTSSNRGIARVPLRDFDDLDAGRIPALRASSFGRQDGMLSAQCNGASQPAGWRARGGRLYFANTRGLVEIEPERLVSNARVPPVVLESVRADGRAVDLRATRELPAGVRRTEFQYAALTYLSPEKVRFRIRLEGFDPSWVDVGARRTAYFTHLPAGSYVFRVTAANADGVWNPEGAALAFTVRPRPWETWWFRGLAAALVFGALWGVHRLRTWRLARRERELVRLVDQRTEELRASNAELTRLAALDGLTRLANRAAFDRTLARMWAEHHRRGAPLALLLVDIDEFKPYNDTYGHQSGDEALVRVAAALQAGARRASDLAARYGGEEFVLLLADTPLEKAMGVAEGLLASVRALALPHAASRVAPVVTVSVGAASMVPAAESAPADLVARADSALYRAKSEGRNRAVACNLPGLKETA